MDAPPHRVNPYGIMLENRRYTVGYREVPLHPPRPAVHYRRDGPSLGVRHYAGREQLRRVLWGAPIAIVEGANI